MNPGIRNMEMTSRIASLKERTMTYPRSMSLEQARIITRVYQENQNLPVPLKRAKALAQSLIHMPIKLEAEELIVGNRTPEIRAGVVFPEAGISWIARELDTLSYRPQDPFYVKEEDKDIFMNEILPYWKGYTMEDHIHGSIGEELRFLEKVIKINQKDHAQGHICPNVEVWLRHGPAGLLQICRDKLKNATETNRDFYAAVCISLEAACKFLDRYADLAGVMAKAANDNSSVQITKIRLMVYSPFGSNCCVYRQPGDHRVTDECRGGQTRGIASLSCLRFAFINFVILY